jgi:hypothetical protein
VTAFTPRVNFIRSYPENVAFFEDYPDGKMICIGRHPTDWFASATRHAGAYRQLDPAMAWWSESAECALELKKRHPDQVILVSFAKLIGDTPDAMRRLSQRLGLAWSSTLLTPTFNGMPIASNSSFTSVVGIDPSVVGRGALLPEDVRRRIEERGLGLYEQFLAAADIT